MKGFKIYVKTGGIKRQLQWLGALLLIIAIVVFSVGIFNYFNLPKEPADEYIYSARYLSVKEMYIAGVIGILGVIFLLAGAFAVSSSSTSQETESAEK